MRLLSPIDQGPFLGTELVNGGEAIRLLGIGIMFCGKALAMMS